MKRLRRVALVVLILAGVAVAGLRYFLNSPYLARQVARRLEAQFGLAVDIESIRVGLTGTSLHNLRLTEKGGYAPLLVVDTVQTDLTPWKLLRGDTVPQRIALRGANLTLGFDGAGNLLACPQAEPHSRPEAEPAPHVHLSEGQVTLKQEGRAALVLSGIDADISGRGKVVVAGTMSDPAWKDWKFHGTFSDAGVELALASVGDVPLSQPLLKGLPFVPPEVWRAVRYEGPAAVEVHFTSLAGDETPHYRVRLSPRRGDLQIPAIDWTCNRACGDVVVEDGRVTLADLKAEAFGGSVQVTGVLDFARENPRLELHEVVLTALDVQKIPPTWQLPPAAAGRVSGSGQLQCELSGAMAVKNLRLNGQAQLGSLTVRGDVWLDLDGPGRSGYRIKGDTAEASELLHYWPELAAEVRGPLAFAARGNLGGSWAGGGEVVMSRGDLWHVPVSGWHIPLAWSYSAEKRLFEVDVKGSTAQVAHGRAGADARLFWNRGLSLDGTVRFTDVDLHTLTGHPEKAGDHTRLTGAAVFTGDDIRSVRDLRANLNATFNESHAATFPVVGPMLDMLPGPRPAWFQHGEVRARMSGGAARLDRLTLEGNAFRLFVEGTVTAEGRLDLTATAHTARDLPPGILSRLGGARLPAETARTLGDVLSSFLIHVRVTGTVDQPAYQIQPLPVLTEETVRFFLPRLPRP